MSALYVGKSGSGNSLIISNGGVVESATGAIGYDAAASNNSVLVTGEGSIWDGGGIEVGSGGSSNSLVVSNGGRVSSAIAYIGKEASAYDNSVLVTGSNSVWTNGSGLTVGDLGSGNSLVIDGGAQVANSTGYIGNGGSNNSVVVSDAGTLWTNSLDVYVGNAGSGSSLTISNGAQVANVTGWIGNQSPSSNNIVVVSDAGTLWTNAGDVYVGNDGSGNSLTISNGAQVANSYGYIGHGAPSSNNSVLVIGANSLWNSVIPIVGVHGSGSTLTVADGGAVAASGLRIAEVAGSSGTLNIGRFGTNDAAGTIIAPTIAFGAGTGAINFNQSDSTTVSAAISGNGTVNQLGTGTTILSASNTYTGATAVNGGQLVVDGSINNSTVTVNNGGTLAGSGSVGGIVLNLGSTISPGNSPGTLNVAGNSVWNAGANYNWQLYNTALGAGTGWDLVNATGTLDLSALTVGSEFNINLWSLQSVAPDANGNALNFNPNQSYTWTILTAAGGISGFTGSSQFDINIGAFNGTGGFANALNGGSFSIAQSLDGKDLNLVFTAAGGAPVPEPGTWAAAALLVGGAAFLRWRKRAKVS
jgi:T5SS/PEP-CTERM-associated repeat protein/autotransporter-associated beta strand protein